MAPRQSTTLHNLLRLFRHLNARRRRLLWLLVGLAFFSAISEIAALGLILPFLALILSPDQAFENPLVQQLAKFAGITSPGALLLPVTLAFATVAVVAGAARLSMLYATTRFAFGLASELSTEAYRRTLYQPYVVHASRNTAEVIGIIKAKMDGVISGIVLPILTMSTALILLVAIVTTLFLIDAVVATIAMVGFGGVYVLVSYLSRHRIRKLSRTMADNQTLVFRALQEGLNGIRDVLLSGAQEKYTSTYRNADLPQRRATGSVIFLSQGTRYVVEACAMLMIAFLAYTLAQQPNGAAAAIPTLGALALGGQRLLPALQQLFGSWSSIVGHSVYLDDALASLDQPIPENYNIPRAALPFQSAVELRDVSYRYNPSGPRVLQGLSLRIAKGTRVGLIGPTGGGKSTLADVIMGFLEPEDGELLVDGVPVKPGNVAAWQKNVSHVPQQIYLLDGSFAENIAIGDAAAPLDIDRVKRSAAGAHIASFIEASPGGYDGVTGENGAKLSGGQRQRVGIARALYKDAQILVLDEATSALDHETEAAVMKSLEDLDRNLTIVVIAHRLSTLRMCDVVLRIDNGSIAAVGSYAEMVTGA